MRRRGPTVLEVPALELKKGEVLALVGPNGAGKTTLLLVLARLLRPHSGKIVFDGRPFTQWKLVEYRRKTSFVFQSPLLLDMTVAANVGLGLRFRGLPKEQISERVNEWLLRLGIIGLARRRARELSGGEAQRVSLARALVLEPELLLLDEPFSGLDPPSRLKLREELMVLLGTDHCTVVIVTHDLEDAAGLGDRVAVLLGGRLRQVGQPRQVSASPADDEVAAFLKDRRPRPN